MNLNTDEHRLIAEDYRKAAQDLAGRKLFLEATKLLQEAEKYWPVKEEDLDIPMEVEL